MAGGEDAGGDNVRVWRIDKVTGCHEWQGPRNEKGYGKVRYKGRTWLVHRAVWDEANGPIPAGMFVCHSCDRPCCGALGHLFLGTPQDNQTDMVQKGRHFSVTKPWLVARGERTRSAKLTAELVAEMRRSYTGQRGEQRRLAVKYGVTFAQANRILLGKSWRHVKV